MKYKRVQYFNLNRILLLTVGLWPNYQSRVAQFQYILCFSIFVTSILFQCATFLTSRCTLDFVIHIFSSTFFSAVILTIYISFGVNIKVVKDLLAQLYNIYNQLNDVNEYAIVEKYNYYAKCYTIGLTTLGVCSTFTILVGQYWSYILDMVVPINESRTHNMLFTAEYFIDQDRYLVLSMLHMSVAWCVGIMTMVATGATLIAYFEYTCGMFKIASYRIEQAVNIDVLKNNNLKEILTFKGIICAVNIQRKAMKLSTQLLSRFEIMFLFLIIFHVSSMSLNLFRITSSKFDIRKLILPVTCVTANVIYMFLSNNVGQRITDHNNEVYATVYNVQWYLAPLHIQKMLLFLLQRAASDFSLRVGGLFIASFECFATLVKASVSYFTVIYSTW
ncbi:odorant receptor 43a-like isoform X2 [Linepithema humile]|uniref:odorant receptor 43a-like isoform X2 n=1 Tax=Linepithema humile TaxID=83485 RepID=UPI00351E6E1A